MWFLAAAVDGKRQRTETAQFNGTSPGLGGVAEPTSEVNLHHCLRTQIPSVAGPASGAPVASIHLERFQSHRPKALQMDQSTEDVFALNEQTAVVSDICAAMLIVPSLASSLRTALAQRILPGRLEELLRHTLFDG